METVDPSRYHEPAMYLVGYLLSLQNFADVIGYDGTSLPVEPVQQQPETTFPYILYSPVEAPGSADWWSVTGAVDLAIYSDSLSVSGVLKNIIWSELNKQDISAARVNHWAARAGGWFNGEPQIEFKWIRVAMQGEIQPTQEKGGAMARYVRVEYVYMPMSGDLIDYV